MNRDSQSQLITVEQDLLEGWQRHQVTTLIWRKLCQDFRPYSALLTCKPEDLGRYQAQAEMMEVLKTYFQPKE